MMVRSTILAAALGTFAALPAVYFFTEPARQDSAAARGGNAVAETSFAVESWPICTSMEAFAEGPAWAPLDPDFAAGKRALASGNWTGAIAALTPAALRDSRNADIQNYLGYAYRRLGQLDSALAHYQQAVALNPRHHSAHGHLGEAFLAVGSLARAEKHLAALERICLIPCEEYDNLKGAIAAYKNLITR